MADAEMKIREFIERRFRPQARGAAFDRETALFSSGIVDSFGVLELIAFLEETFAITLDPSEHELGEFDTVAKIVTLVGALKTDSPGA